MTKRGITPARGGALWLGFHLHLGITGLWWGLCAGLTLVAVQLFFRFERLSKRGIEPIRHATG